MHRFSRRRFPAELHTVARTPPKAHAPGWHDGEAESPVVDLDDIDPVASPTTKGPFGDGVAPSGTTNLIGPEGEIFQVGACFNVGKDPSFVTHDKFSLCLIYWTGESTLYVIHFRRHQTRG